MRRKGFTLIELLVVVAIIALLVSILLPGLARARELAKQATCLASLNGVGKAVALYSADQKDKTPRLADIPLTAPGTASYSTTTTAGTIWVPQTGPTPAAGDGLAVASLGVEPMQNMWILIAAGMLKIEAFHCPSDSAWNARAASTTANTKYGWTKKDQISYGLHIPYDGTSASALNQAAWTANLDPGLVIMADRIPMSSGTTASKVDGTATPPVKPACHEKDGMAMLSAGGSCSFYKVMDPTTGMPKDSKGGYNGDDIYVNGAGATNTLPVDNTSTTLKAPFDTVIYENK